MKISLKKYWGIIPFCFYLILQMAVLAYEKITSTVLRNVPEMFMFWFATLSVLLLVFWIGCKILEIHKIKKWKGHKILRFILSTLYIVLVTATMGIGLFASAFSNNPEYVIERNGIRMVASVNSFLQEMVYYYEYKNLLFRGEKQIGWEDYGNGGRDPIEQSQKPLRWYFEDLNGNVVDRSSETEQN